ncbi:MAG TPA: YbhB/YbcL family Raf kinase inhibitor-like protein [Candidatus Polarisedimenticolaceae bacterium]|nr:YbhB/YbcL family Raf kinase inhibitor-like protein [Candidatus Polarisedimenticolaceae bacterium]
MLLAGTAAPVPTPAPSAKEGVIVSLKLASTAFKPDGAIPSRFTCDGSNVSPPLAWTDLPAGTKTLAVVVTDPDAPDPAAPKMTWVHWVVYNIPAAAGTGLREAITAKALPAGALEGTNDWGRTGYGGPCPPIGRHRYVHTLYALDTVLDDLERPTRAALLAAMHGHVLATAELIGTYQRQ